MTAQNPYPGVNAHLNSLLVQPGGGWKSFHTVHINHIFEAVQAQLPKGYVAFPETSLQIGVYDRDVEDFTVRSTGADVAVYQDQSTTTQDKQPQASTPTVLLPLVEYLPEEVEISSVMIYKAEPDKLRGRAVTRLELLSPANKPGGSHYDTYLIKREETLRAGLRHVEIDYIHTRASVISRIPSYPAGDADAVPYTVLVMDPRPTFDDGTIALYAVGVLDALPIVAIPLEEDDTATLDLQAAYNRSYTVLAGLHRLLDYSAVPANFGAYAPTDQDVLRAFLSATNNTLY